jgi:hypothetical protein
MKRYYIGHSQHIVGGHRVVGLMEVQVAHDSYHNLYTIIKQFGTPDILDGNY